MTCLSFLQSITENGDIQEFGHKWQQKSAAASKDTAALSICGLLLLPVVVDVLDVVMLGTKSPVGKFRNPLKIKHFQDLRLSKVAVSVPLVCHNSRDKIKYN